MRRSQVFGLLFALCYVATKGQAEELRCLWYGECGLSEKQLPRTCVSEDFPQLINDTTAEDILKKKCPHLFQNGSYLEIDGCRESSESLESF